MVKSVTVPGKCYTISDGDRPDDQFMMRAFPPSTVGADAPHTNAAAMIKICRPQEELD